MNDSNRTMNNVKWRDNPNFPLEKQLAKLRNAYVDLKGALVSTTVPIAE